MNKEDRIKEYVHKIANKEHITEEQAEQLAVTKEFVKMVEGESTLIFDNTQTILNQSTSEEAPTEEEIDQVVEYFKMSDPTKAREIYLEPLIAKHGEKWVDAVVYAVMNTILSGKIKEI